MQEAKGEDWRTHSSEKNPSLSYTGVEETVLYFLTPLFLGPSANLLQVQFKDLPVLYSFFLNTNN